MRNHGKILNLRARRIENTVTTARESDDSWGSKVLANYFRTFLLEWIRNRWREPLAFSRFCPMLTHSRILVDRFIRKGNVVPRLSKRRVGRFRLPTEIITERSEATDWISRRPIRPAWIARNRTKSERTRAIISADLLRSLFYDSRSLGIRSGDKWTLCRRAHCATRTSVNEIHCLFLLASCWSNSLLLPLITLGYASLTHHYNGKTCSTREAKLLSFDRNLIKRNLRESTLCPKLTGHSRHARNPR